MPNGLLLKDKQARILIMLKNTQQPWYLSTLAKASDTTYVHTSNFIRECEKIGIITNEKHGKIKQVRLTEKGHQLADMLNSVYALVAPPQKTEETKPQPQAEKK